MTDAMELVSQRKLRKIMKSIVVNITEIEYDMNINASKLKSMSSHFILYNISSSKNDTEWLSCLNRFTDLLRKKRCFTNYLQHLKRLDKEHINNQKDVS